METSEIGFMQLPEGAILDMNDMVQYTSFSGDDGNNSCICAKEYVPDIQKDVFYASSNEISPDDDIEISHWFSVNAGSSKVTMTSRTIKFRDLCEAIARQLVKNDLAVSEDFNETSSNEHREDSNGHKQAF